MRLILCLLLLSGQLAFSDSRALKAQETFAGQPAILATRLYRQVIARHPIGVPEGKELDVFRPYLSSALLHSMDQYRACTSDWDRKNAGSSSKSPVGLFENDIFSGAYEEATPQTFRVEKTQSEGNGRLRVYIKLTSVSPPAPPSVWQVAIQVSRERGQFLVDDIIYLKGENHPTDERLTEYFSKYCRGPQYVGRQ